MLTREATGANFPVFDLTIDQTGDSNLRPSILRAIALFTTVGATYFDFRFLDFFSMKSFTDSLNLKISQ